MSKETIKKSEVLKQIDELLERNEVLLKEVQQKEYDIDFKHKSIYTSLLKFLEKESPWGHTTAAGLIMLYNNMKQQKPLTIRDDWDGIIKLRSANVSILWTMLTQMKGNGFHEAKRFVELMASIGETLSNAVNQVHVDNKELRENHSKINDLESMLTDPTKEIINDVEDESPAKSLIDEVDPVIENI